MERAVEIYAAVLLLVIGLSHVFQSRAWVEFFIWLRENGYVGVFANGFLSLTFGAVVVAFHNVWTGLPVILTLVGWAQVIKALVAFVMPTWSMRSLERVSVDRAHEFVVAGALFLVLSGLLGYIVLTT